MLNDIIPDLNKNLNLFRTICPIAKQSILPFKESDSRTESVFYLIHCDVWGPHKVQTYYGCSYFIFFNSSR